MAKTQISLDHIDDDTVDTAQGSNTDPLEPTTPATPSQTSTPVNAPTKPSKFEAELWQRIRTATAPFAAAVKAGFDKKIATEKKVAELGFTGYHAPSRTQAIENEIGSAGNPIELSRLVLEYIRLTHMPDAAIRAARRLIAQDFHSLRKALTPALDAAIIESKAALADAGQLESKIFGEYGLPTAPTQFSETCQRIVAQIEGMKEMLQSKTERLLSSCDHPANLDYGQFKRIFE